MFNILIEHEQCVKKQQNVGKWFVLCMKCIIIMKFLYTSKSN